MKAVVEAMAEAANLAYLVRDETQSLEFRLAAERVLSRLAKATDRIITLKQKEDSNVRIHQGGTE